MTPISAPQSLTITPGSPLRGEVVLPGDKSLSHRAALLAAMAEGESRIENFLVSGVTHAMLDSLRQLGVEWRLDGTTLAVQGAGLSCAGQPAVQPGQTLNCGNSATTLRLLAGAVAAWGVPAVLDGSPGLRKRPMQRIADPLRQMGMEVQDSNGCAPLSLRLQRRKLRGITCALDVASAQVKSCILLAALSASGQTTVSEPGPSRDHTERMLRAMGVSVDSHARGQPFVTRLVPPDDGRLRPLHMRLPCDMSAAAFLIVAALITPGSEITLRGVGLNPTRTGLIEALAEMGGDVQSLQTGDQGGEPVGDVTVRHSRLHAIEVYGERVVRMIDEFPVFAVAAAYAEGRTLVRDAQELRLKESDRIGLLGRELSGLGVTFDETPDGFAIEGRGEVRGGAGEAHGDHRLAMSLAVAGLAARQPTRVAGAEIVAESFPDFAHTLQGLGADIRVQSEAEQPG
jgi:3-phosphoshikimate 1-carboxyvinyltransferase